jgi:hypothetical protein
MKMKAIRHGNDLRSLLKHNEDRRESYGHQHNCLVVWNDNNKSESWVNFIVLSLSNLTPIIIFARTNNFLREVLFRHLFQYCKSKT